MTEKLQEAAQQVRELAKRVEQDSEEVLGDDGMVMVVPLDAYNDMMEAITALREALQQPVSQEPVKREHITDGSPCWCNPELNYKDPETGAEVWVHKEPQ